MKPRIRIRLATIILLHITAALVLGVNLMPTSHFNDAPESVLFAIGKRVQEPPSVSLDRRMPNGLYFRIEKFGWPSTYRTRSKLVYIDDGQIVDDSGDLSPKLKELLKTRLSTDEVDEHVGWAPNTFENDWYAKNSTLTDVGVGILICISIVVLMEFILCVAAHETEKAKKESEPRKE